MVDLAAVCAGCTGGAAHRLRGGGGSTVKARAVVVVVVWWRQHVVCMSGGGGGALYSVLQSDPVVVPQPATVPSPHSFSITLLLFSLSPFSSSLSEVTEASEIPQYVVISRAQAHECSSPR